MPPCGLFFCVSLLQRHVLSNAVRFRIVAIPDGYVLVWTLEMLLSRFVYGFHLSIERIDEQQEKQVSEIQSFLFIAERQNAAENLPPIQLDMTSSTPSSTYQEQTTDIANVLVSSTHLMFSKCTRLV